MAGFVGDGEVMGPRALTCLSQGGWTVLAPLCPVDFCIFQMSQEEEVLEMEDMLSLEDSEMFIMAEAPGQREGERPAGAEAPGSKKQTEPPGPLEEQGPRSVWGGEVGAPSQTGSLSG